MRSLTILSFNKIEMAWYHFSFGIASSCKCNTETSLESKSTDTREKGKIHLNIIGYPELRTVPLNSWV